MGVGKIFGIHFGDFGSRSISQQSGTLFTFHGKVRTAHTIATKLGRYIPLSCFPPDWFFLDRFCNFFWRFFFVKFEIRFPQYLGNGRPDCHGMKGTGVNSMPFKVKWYLGNGRPGCHGMKGTGVDSMPWCKTQPLCDPEAEDIVTDGVT